MRFLTLVKRYETYDSIKLKNKNGLFAGWPLIIKEKNLINSIQSIYSSLMHPNEQLIRNFYLAFQERKSEPMGDSYSENAEFSDPIFPCLKGREIFGMWSMLLESMDKDGKISSYNIVANDNNGSCDWEASYKFSRTGRTVHNKIQSKFEFVNGKIIRHRDYFSFFKWASMAFGFRGILLGWTPFLKNRVRDELAKTLKMYMKRRRIQ